MIRLILATAIFTHTSSELQQIQQDYDGALQMVSYYAGVMEEADADITLYSQWVGQYNTEWNTTYAEYVQHLGGPNCDGAGCSVCAAQETHLAYLTSARDSAMALLAAAEYEYENAEVNHKYYTVYAAGLYDLLYEHGWAT